MCHLRDTSPRILLPDTQRTRTGIEFTFYSHVIARRQKVSLRNGREWSWKSVQRVGLLPGNGSLPSLKYLNKRFQTWQVFTPSTERSPRVASFLLHLSSVLADRPHNTHSFQSSAMLERPFSQMREWHPITYWERRRHYLHGAALSSPMTSQ